MIGKVIGHYHVEVLLGTGGMGEVYQARDTKLGRNVAVKVLPEIFAGDVDRVVRFEREAKLLASLNHANIATLYGMEQADGKHILVMELVEGETLAQRIARGPIPVEEMLKFAHQITEALEAAHEKGVIHRDLKPANVKVTPEGKIKVLDFGLAKALEGAPAQMTSNSPTMLSAAATNAGVILGTAGYMSPEQARGHDADQRSDIFSVGCVLFEMLTGRQTFQGETVTDIIASVVARDPDWRAIPLNVHPRMEGIIRRCLAKNRKERWHAVADVRLELEMIMDDPHGVKTMALQKPQRPLWRRALPFAITALIAIAATLATTRTLTNRRSPPSANVTRFPLVLTEQRSAAPNATNWIRLAISPDGSNIVYTANQQLYLRTMEGLEERPIQGTSNATSPFFSADGRWVGYLALNEEKLKKIPITGGTAVTITGIERIGYGTATWSSDDYIYIATPKGIARVPASGGDLKPVITLKEDETASHPQLLPGGDELLFTLATGVATDRWEKAQIVVQSLKSGDRKVLIRGGRDGRYLPTGHIIYALGATLFVVPFDLGKVQLTGGSVAIVDGVMAARVFGEAQFSFSENGSMAYIPQNGEEGERERVLALVDRNGNRKPLNIPPGMYSQPRISPDGKQLVVDLEDGKNRNIWIYDLSDGAPIHKVTFDGYNQAPLWTPDGQSIVFTSDRDGDQGLFRQRVDGGPAGRIAKLEKGLRPQSETWTPDGKVLIFTNRTATLSGVGAAANEGISALSLGSDRPPELVIKENATNAVLSNDGQWLAYVGTESIGRGGGRVFVEPFPATGEKHQVTTEQSGNPLWSPVGQQLYFTRGGQIFAVDVRTKPSFVAGKVTPLPIAGIVNPGSRPYDVTPDGKYFLVMFPEASPEPNKVTSDQIIVTLNWFEELKRNVPPK